MITPFVVESGKLALHFQFVNSVCTSSSPLSEIGQYFGEVTITARCESDSSIGKNCPIGRAKSRTRDTQWNNPSKWTKDTRSKCYRHRSWNSLVLVDKLASRRVYSTLNRTFHNIVQNGLVWVYILGSQQFACGHCCKVCYIDQEITDCY